MSLRACGQWCHVVWMIESLLVSMDKGFLYKQTSRGKLRGGEWMGSRGRGEVVTTTLYVLHIVRHLIGVEQPSKKWVKSLNAGCLTYEGDKCFEDGTIASNVFDGRVKVYVSYLL